MKLSAFFPEIQSRIQNCSTYSDFGTASYRDGRRLYFHTYFKRDCSFKLVWTGVDIFIEKELEPFASNEALTFQIESSLQSHLFSVNAGQKVVLQRTYASLLEALEDQAIYSANLTMLVVPLLFRELSECSVLFHDIANAENLPDKTFEQTYPFQYQASDGSLSIWISPETKLFRKIQVNSTETIEPLSHEAIEMGLALAERRRGKEFALRVRDTLKSPDKSLSDITYELISVSLN